MSVKPKLNLKDIQANIKEPSKLHIEKALKRQNILTKPIGSLGRLEELSVKLSGIRRLEDPNIENPVVIVAAGSHGVTKQGVSAYPDSVTAEMLNNFLRGGAAINVLAKSVGASVSLVDAGVFGSYLKSDNILVVGEGKGTKDFTETRAMTTLEVNSRLEAGFYHSINLIEQQEVDLIVLGDMGIGNTTSASAITSFILGISPDKVTGYGTGVNEETRLKKVSTIQKAFKIHSPNKDDGIEILSCFGGFEIVFLAGCVIGAAFKSTPIVIDGFPTSAAALTAKIICPNVKHYLLPSHSSKEPAHSLVLDYLELKALFDFEMRLGEGSGGVLAIPFLKGACLCLNEMATFEEAGVSSGK